MVKQYKVLISAQTQASLNHIVDYLTEYASLQKALSTERKLLEDIQALKTFPNGHSPLRINRKKSKNPYRFFLLKNTKLFIL